MLIEPIDGSWDFASRLALFGVILAVVEAGETVAGVLYDPIGDDAVIAGPCILGTMPRACWSPRRPAASRRWPMVRSVGQAAEMAF